MTDRSSVHDASASFERNSQRKTYGPQPDRPKRTLSLNKTAPEIEVQNTASNWNKLKGLKGIGHHIHHARHHVPKEHATHFGWLDFQYERQISAISKGSTMSHSTTKKMDILSKNKAKKKEDSVTTQALKGLASVASSDEWVDLNSNITTWEDWFSPRHLFYNLTRAYDGVKVWLMGKVGVQLTELNVKIYGSHKGVYLQNLNLIKTANRANTILIHPQSQLRQFWDIVSIILLFFQVLLLPLGICGMWDLDKSWPFLFNLFCDIWFLIDIWLNFKTGIFIDSSEIILEPDEIRKHYLSGWFVMDLISTVPPEVLTTMVSLISRYAGFNYVLTTYGYSPDATASGQQANMNALRLFKAGRMLKILRLLRVSRLIRYVKMIEKLYEDHYDTLNFSITIFQWVVLEFVMAHVNACFIYGSAVDDLNQVIPESWLEVAKLKPYPQTGFKELYIHSVFKSFSHMICIGYGQLPPSHNGNLAELLATIWSILSGAVCFAFFLGSIISSIQQMNASKRIYTEEYLRVCDYMHFRHIPKALQERVYEYYEYRFQGRVFNEDEILSELNPVLRRTVLQYNQLWLINTAEMFEDCSMEFKDALCDHFNFELYLQGDKLYTTGSKQS